MDNCIEKVFLIYESRQDWIQRNLLKKNCDYFSRFLASEKEVEIIAELLRKKNLQVDIIMYPYHTMKQIDEIISQDNKCIIWNLTDGYEQYIGAHVPSFVHFFSKPFVGSSTFTQSLCQNKHFTKSILCDYNISTPAWISVHKEEKNINHINNLNYPLFIKPAKYDNSIGTEFIEPIAHSKEDAIIKVEKLLDSGIDDILIEEYIDGQEITLAAIHADEWYILPLVREYEGAYISSYAKDNEKGFLKKQTILKDDFLVNLTKKIIDILQIKDYCRIDLRMKNKIFYILEINTATFLTTTSFKILANQYFGTEENMFYQLIQNSYLRQNL